VRMRRGSAPPQQLTCQAKRSSPALTHTLVGIDRLG
jgi:hypothetical protein